MELVSTSPAEDYKSLGSIPVSSTKEIQVAAEAAISAKLVWKTAGLGKRLEYLERLYQLFESRKEEVAQRITLEVGKPITQTRAEVRFFQTYNRWMLENAKRILADEVTFEDENSVHKVIYEPLGVAAVILPWNSPFGILSWKLFSNLIAGNTIVVKHSEECPLIANYLDQLIRKINLPQGVYSQIYGDGSIGVELLRQDIDLVCFSGSSATGSKIASLTAGRFIKLFLEMGGSNPGIVFEDAKIEKIVSRIFAGRFNNCGQNCDAIKRLFVQEKVYTDVVDALNSLLNKKIIGRSEDEKTDFGTLVSKGQVELANEQLDDALSKGAKILGQLQVPKELKGAYFPPTFLGSVTKNMRVWKEEVFAPILPIIPFKDEDEAISLANDTNYGLGATIFTENKEKAKRVSGHLDCSNVELNNVSQFLPCNPFGGIKDSAVGSQHGNHGMRELCNMKVLSFEK